MDFETIMVRKEDGVCLITLNRPQVRNAIDDRMAFELATALADAAKDDNVRALVLTGAGEAFCSGADFRFAQVRSGQITAAQAEAVKALYEKDIGKGQLLHQGQSGMILALQSLGKPTIAMVNGAAVGGGFDLALACDLRVGSEKARFMVAYTRLGLVPDLGTSWFLPRVVGLGKALELILSGDLCDAEEAYRTGILNKLVTSEELEKVNMELARKLASGPPIAQRLSKLMVYKGLNTDLETALEFLSAALVITLASEDHEEAVRAFAEKRLPLFKGR